MLKIPYLSQYKRLTTIKSSKIEQLFPPKSPFSCLTHPIGWFWSIFFSETFRISYSHLVEWISTLGSGIQTIWKITLLGPDPLSLSPPKWWNYISQAITPSWISSPISPPPGPSISGWLLCVSSSIGSCLSPWRDSFHIIFSLSQSSPKQWDSVFPHTPTPARPLSNIPLTAMFLLSFGHKANSFPISMIFEG